MEKVDFKIQPTTADAAPPLPVVPIAGVPACQHRFMTGACDEENRVEKVTNLYFCGDDLS